MLCPADTNEKIQVKRLGFFGGEGEIRKDVHFPLKQGISLIFSVKD